MSAPKWTPAQRAAIEDRGGTLLVSAAAGSGKTAVLVERAVRLITDAAHPVAADRLLIVTFTRAAAEELRGRIAVRLAAEATAHPESAYLRRQRLLLGRANICTIDAFCMQLLKRYFAELGLPPDFELADDAKAYTLRQNALSAVLRGVGDSRTPLYFLIASSLANIVMDVVFVVCFHMGVGGVAWATFLCQGVASVLAAWTLFRRLRGVPAPERHPLFSWRMLGRIAFPLYCWCMVVGICYTRSVPKYLGRLMLIGLVSQPIYMVALNHSWNQPNIFLTLLVALCGVWGLKAKKLLSHIWAPILALFAAQLLGCDYGWRGVMLVMLLYGVRGSRAGIACVMIAFCLYWGGSSVGVTHLFGQDVTPLTSSAIGAVISPWLRLQTMAIWALPLMLLPISQQVKMPRWVGYALYPLHLVVLIALEAALAQPIHTENLINAWNAFVSLF